MLKNIFLYLTISLLFCLSLQQNCISAIKDRLTFGDLLLHLPGFKVGGYPLKFGCLNEFVCFADIDQYYVYSDAVQKDLSCDCSAEKNTKNVYCIIPAIKNQNKGLISNFDSKNVFVNNEDVAFQSVTFVFSQQKIQVGDNTINQWILLSANPKIAPVSQ